VDHTIDRVREFASCGDYFAFLDADGLRMRALSPPPFGSMKSAPGSCNAVSRTVVATRPVGSEVCVNYAANTSTRCALFD
jgi:hypothetical protein